MRGGQFAGEMTSLPHSAAPRLLACRSCFGSMRQTIRSASPCLASIGHACDGGGLVFLGLFDGTVAAFDDATLDELWKINVGSPFAAPPMTFEFNGKQYVAIASGRSPLAKRRADNIPELKEQRNATVLYVFGL